MYKTQTCNPLIIDLAQCSIMTKQQQTLPTHVTFAIAGASGITAWLAVHPFDVVKVRMQLDSQKGKSPSPIATMRGIYASGGVSALYAGLSAALARQAVYTTARLGLYDVIRPLTVREGEAPTVWHRAATGLAAGGTASFISCPIEVCLVRMQADGKLPMAQRRGYTHIGNALVRIAGEEGVHTYWRGATPTVARAMVVSMTQLGTYDQAKSMLTPYLGTGTSCHLASASAAAVVYSWASLPLDVAKTRVQAAKVGKGEAVMGMGMALKSIVVEEGFLKLWKGFGPYFARSALHTMGMFIVKEWLTNQYKCFVSSQ